MTGSVGLLSTQQITAAAHEVPTRDDAAALKDAFFPGTPTYSKIWKGKGILANVGADRNAGRSFDSPKLERCYESYEKL